MNLNFSASLMCADFSNLYEQLLELKELGITRIHFDVMDGHFVPNITLGPDIADNLIKKTSMKFDAHLMISNPSVLITRFLEIPFNSIDLHIEAVQNDVFRLFNEINSHGIKCGIALSPATPVSMIEHVVSRVQRVIIMSVDPGFAGQKFIPEVLNKIDRLDEIRRKQNLNFEIEIDGSVNKKTIPKILKHPVDSLVLGTSGLFGHPKGLKVALEELRNLI